MQHSLYGIMRILLWLAREENEISSTDHKHLFDVTNDVSGELPRYCSDRSIDACLYNVINVILPTESAQIQHSSLKLDY